MVSMLLEVPCGERLDPVLLRRHRRCDRRRRHRRPPNEMLRLKVQWQLPATLSRKNKRETDKKPHLGMNDTMTVSSPKSSIVRPRIASATGIQFISGHTSSTRMKT